MKSATHKRHAKIPAIILALVLIVSLLPAGVLAASDGEIPESSGTFTFTDGGVTATVTDSGAYKIDGTTLKIKAAGVYTITGSCAEGAIQVNKGTAGVTLILKDLTLSCSATAPLACNKGTETTIYVVGTVTLNDNETDEGSEDYEGAAIKVKSGGAALTIRGTGTLNVNGNAKNGVKGAAGSAITIDGATINVAAANTGIADDNLLVINGGVINVTAGNDGLKASPDDGDAESLGNLIINGGVITVSAGDDALHADGDLTVNGGTITVSAGDDALHADGSLTVNDGEITVTKSYEGLEGAQIYLNGGKGVIAASDDSVNAASDANGTVAIEINGGSWYVNAGGDGLDAGGESNRGNGAIVINGGVTEVYGAADNGNGALDSESGVTYNGGTILAVGMSGMAEAPGGEKVLVFGSAAGGMMGGMPAGADRMNGRQGFVGGQAFGAEQNRQRNDAFQAQGGGSVAVAAGSSIVIKDSEGNEIYSATAVKNADSIVFASDGVVAGGTYTLYVNGSAAAAATAGAAAAGGAQAPGPQDDRQPDRNQNQQSDRPNGQDAQSFPGGRNTPQDQQPVAGREQPFGQNRIPGSFGGPSFGGMEQNAPTTDGAGGRPSGGMGNDPIGLQPGMNRDRPFGGMPGGLGGPQNGQMGGMNGGFSGGMPGGLIMGR